MDWPALVRAIVQSLDDVGCRPRQFSAKQARAIRKAQAALGYTDALWEGWKESAAQKDTSGEGEALNALSAEALSGLLGALGLQREEVGENTSDELWGAGEGVFVWGNAEGQAQGGDFPGSPQPQHRGTRDDLPKEGEHLNLPGISLNGLSLRDIHLVPVTGGDGWEGARMPFINVRAKCAPQGRTFLDRSPWGR